MTDVLKTYLVAVLLVLLGGRSAKDDSDSDDSRSGMVPTRDALTGCEYLIVYPAYSARGVAITPRMGADGKQVCGRRVER